MKIAVGFNNGIGNFVMFTPALRVLYELNEGPIDLYLYEEWRDNDLRKTIKLLAEHHLLIGNVFEYPKDFDEKNYDRYFMSCHNYPDGAFQRFAPRTGISIDRMSPPWAFGDAIHEIQYFIDEVREDFGYNGPIPDQSIYFDVEDEYEFLRDHPPSALKICISNGFLRTPSGAWDRKSYPYWNKLLYTMMKYYNFGDDEVRIFLIGGKADISWGRSVDKLGGRVIDLTGQTDILQTSNLILMCDLIISTDTGAMHIADALRKPGVAIFGSTLVSKNGPWNGTILSATSKLDCAPCQSTVNYEPCKEPKKCMASITIPELFPYVKRIISSI